MMPQAHALRSPTPIARYRMRFRAELLKQLVGSRCQRSAFENATLSTCETPKVLHMALQLSYNPKYEVYKGQHI